MYEKEINLLKQVESINKNQEDKKVMEVANSIQAKLNQKKKLIESLKQKLSLTESNVEALIKASFSRIFELIFYSN